MIWTAWRSFVVICRFEKADRIKAERFMKTTLQSRVIRAWTRYVGQRRDKSRQKEAAASLRALSVKRRHFRMWDRAQSNRSAVRQQVSLASTLRNGNLVKTAWLVWRDRRQRNRDWNIAIHAFRSRCNEKITLQLFDHWSLRALRNRMIGKAVVLSQNRIAKSAFTLWKASLERIIEAKRTLRVAVLHDRRRSLSECFSLWHKGLLERVEAKAKSEQASRTIMKNLERRVFQSLQFFKALKERADFFHSRKLLRSTFARWTCQTLIKQRSRETQKMLPALAFHTGTLGRKALQTWRRRTQISVLRKACLETSIHWSRVRVLKNTFRCMVHRFGELQKEKLDELSAKRMYEDALLARYWKRYYSEMELRTAEAFSMKKAALFHKRLVLSKCMKGFQLNVVARKEDREKAAAAMSIYEEAITRRTFCAWQSFVARRGLLKRLSQLFDVVRTARKQKEAWSRWTTALFQRWRHRAIIELSEKRREEHLQRSVLLGWNASVVEKKQFFTQVQDFLLLREHTLKTHLFLFWYSKSRDARDVHVWLDQARSEMNRDFLERAFAAWKAYASDRAARRWHYQHIIFTAQAQLLQAKATQCLRHWLAYIDTRR
ncbi:hypothetical protein DFJ73DRAFT_959699, partial [Zopfochytrium polystomum]